MTRLERLWKSNISFNTKFKLYKSLVISILLQGCATLILLVEAGKRIQAFKNKCLTKLRHIFYWEHKTNDYVQSKAKILTGRQKSLLSTIKHWKMSWFGHVTRHLQGHQCQALLKADASRNSNTKFGQATSKIGWT